MTNAKLRISLSLLMIAVFLILGCASHPSPNEGSPGRQRDQKEITKLVKRFEEGLNSLDEKKILSCFSKDFGSLHDEPVCEFKAFYNTQMAPGIRAGYGMTYYDISDVDIKSDGSTWVKALWHAKILNFWKRAVVSLISLFTDFDVSEMYKGETYFLVRKEDGIWKIVEWSSNPEGEHPHFLWRKIASTYCDLYYLEENEERARELSSILDDAYLRTAEFFSFKNRIPVNVYLYSDTRPITAWQINRKGRGYEDPPNNSMHLMPSGRALYHELAHIFFQNSMVAVHGGYRRYLQIPYCINEGVAVYFDPRTMVREGSNGYGHLQGMLLRKQWMGSKKWPDRFMELGGMQWSGQGWDLIAAMLYLIEDKYGYEKVKELLVAFRHQPWKEAFQQVCGRSLEELYTDLKAYYKVDSFEHIKKAQKYERSGKVDKALREWRKVLQIDPSNEEAQLKVDLYEDGQATFSDDFDDGRIGRIWDTRFHQELRIALEEKGGQFQVSGRSISRSYEGLELGIFPRSNVTVSVDLRQVPGGADATLELFSRRRRISVRAEGDGYYYEVWDGEQGHTEYRKRLDLFGDEAPRFHRLRVEYEASQRLARTYIDSILVKEVSLDFPNPFIRFGVWLDKPGVKVNASFDDFEVALSIPRKTAR